MSSTNPMKRQKQPLISLPNITYSSKAWCSFSYFNKLRTVEVNECFGFLTLKMSRSVYIESHSCCQCFVISVCCH